MTVISDPARPSGCGTLFNDLDGLGNTAVVAGDLDTSLGGGHTEDTHMGVSPTLYCKHPRNDQKTELQTLL